MFIIAYDDVKFVISLEKIEAPLLDTTHNFKQVSINKLLLICFNEYNSNSRVIISLFTNSKPTMQQDVAFTRFAYTLAEFRDSAQQDSEEVGNFLDATQ